MMKVSLENILYSHGSVIHKIISPYRISLEKLVEWEKENLIHAFIVEDGFFIVRPQIDFLGETILWIIVGYGEGVDLFEKYQPNLIQLAKDINAVRIEFSSNRKGWEKKAIKSGYKIRESIYEMEIK